MRLSLPITWPWERPHPASKRFHRWLGLLLIVSDAVLINVAFAIAYWIRYDLQWFRAVDPAYNTSYQAYLPFVVVLTFLLLIAFRLEGVYSLRRGATWLDEVYAIVNGTTTGIIIMVVVTFFYRPLFYSRLIFLYAAVLIPSVLAFSRAVKSVVVARLRRRGVGVDHVLIVGVGETGLTVLRNLVAQPEYGYRVLGFLDDNPERGRRDIGPFKALGGIDNLTRILSTYRVDEVIVALPWQYHGRIARVISEAGRAGVRVRIVPDLLQLSLNRVHLDQVAGIPLLSVREGTLTSWDRLIKRAMDITIAGLGTILLAPLMALIALAIRLDSPGPVLFRQTRVGRGGKPFTIYKFRSMVVNAEEIRAQLDELNEADGPIFKIRDDPRRTRVGRFLRRSSLDELPQLFNVLRGEMSLVGPRPALPSEVAQYQEWHKKRLEVSPGITGLWQVSGRSKLSFDEMVLLDIYYVENWSPLLDLRIMLKTIPLVLLGEGAY
ncbi:MAG: undecaprenyl-phosphate glucose phosphotransferase [Chloroflexi bacterium]|nr:undecaprenyl-phosphate glucose phosphotransferase [Chloroflexota bacterium]